MNKLIQDDDKCLIDEAKHISSNWYNKRLEESVLGGLYFTIVVWLTRDPNITVNGLTIFFCCSTIFTYLWFRLFYSKQMFARANYIEQYFIGDISELILLMYRSGFILKDWGYNRYMFKTTNLLLSNKHFLVLEQQGYCCILGQQYYFRSLQKDINLQQELQDNNKENSRKGE